MTQTMSATAQATGIVPQRTVPAAIVLYRPDALLLEKQLAALERNGRRLILYANGPLDAAIARRFARLPNAVMLGSPVNLGHGEGLNAVARQAIAEGFSHLLLLDQDSEPSSDLPERLREQLAAAEQQNGRLAAIGPLLVPPPGEGYRAIRYQWRDARRGEALFLPTSGTLLALDAFARIGAFRADYFIGGIDVEWGLRADWPAPIGWSGFNVSAWRVLALRPGWPAKLVRVAQPATGWLPVRAACSPAMNAVAPYCSAAATLR